MVHFHAIAKYEVIITKPIRPPNDGLDDELVQLLTCFDLCRQDES